MQLTDRTQRGEKVGVGSYNLDGNIARSNANLFMDILTYKSAFSSRDSVTSAATIDGNTSEYGLEAMSSLFSENIQIRVKADKKELISLQLFNEQGKVVRYKEINAEAGINFVQLDNTGQLSAGAYFLQLTQEGEKFTRKIIKQ